MRSAPPKAERDYRVQKVRQRPLAGLFAAHGSGRAPAPGPDNKTQPKSSASSPAVFLMSALGGKRTLAGHPAKKISLGFLGPGVAGSGRSSRSNDATGAD
jgi:hypothetical protein